MKKQILKSALMAMAGVGLLAGGAMAIPLGTSLQSVIDNITTSPAGDSSIDVTTDYLKYDSYWSITGANISGATMIIELAGYASTNEFGVFFGNNLVPLFTGSNVAGDQAVLSIKKDGSVFVNLKDTGKDFSGNLFGYYLTSKEGTFFSDTSKNIDGLDHLLAYQGNNSDFIKVPGGSAGLWTDNEFILAWEDQAKTNTNIDYDYDDFVVIVESVTPVPEPATMLLFGTGLAGLAAVARRRKTQA